MGEHANCVRDHYIYIYNEVATLIVEHANYATVVCKTSSRGNAHGWTHKYAILTCITQLVVPIVERIKPIAEHADDKNLNDRVEANTGWVTSPIISPECYGLSIKRCLEAENSNRPPSQFQKSPWERGCSNRWSLSLVGGSGSTGPINLILFQAPRIQSKRNQSKRRRRSARCSTRTKYAPTIQPL